MHGSLRNRHQSAPPALRVHCVPGDSYHIAHQDGQVQQAVRLMYVRQPFHGNSYKRYPAPLKKVRCGIVNNRSQWRRGAGD